MIADYLYATKEECIEDGEHCKDTDDDEFCNLCGYEPEENIPIPKKYVRSQYKAAGRAYSRDEKTAILARLLEVWEKYEDMRLGQLIANARNDSQPSAIYYVEDEKLIEMVEKLLIDHPPSPKKKEEGHDDQ